MTFTPDHDAVLLGGSIAGTDYKTANFGASNPLDVGSAQRADERSILSFNVSTLGSLPITVQSITLRVFATTQEAPGVTLSPQVHAITEANQAWVEGTGNATFPATDNGWATWNAAQQGTLAWAGGPGLATSGVAYDSTTLSSVALTNYTAGSAIDFNFSGTSTQLTTLINNWLADNITLGRPNPGLLMFDPTVFTTPVTDFDRLGFSSREAISSLRPELIVTYTPVSVPEPASASLALLGMALVALGVARRKFWASAVC